MTWWMSNSKAASKMLSRGSETLLESRNIVMHDCSAHTCKQDTQTINQGLLHILYNQISNFKLENNRATCTGLKFVTDDVTRKYKNNAILFKTKPAVILKCWMMWEYGVPEHNNATLWVSLWGGRREVSWQESDTRYPAAPCDPAKCLHLPEGSRMKRGGDI